MDVLYIVSGMSFIISISALIYAARAQQACDNIAYWIAENIKVIEVSEHTETEKEEEDE